MKWYKNLSDYHQRIVKTAFESFFGTLAATVTARISGVDLGSGRGIKTFAFTVLGSALAAAITAVINIESRPKNDDKNS